MMVTQSYITQKDIKSSETIIYLPHINLMNDTWPLE